MNPSDQLQTKIIAKSKLKVSEPEQEISLPQDINWKLPLALGFCHTNETMINYQRAWAGLCNNIRQLCPETNWVMIELADPQHVNPLSLQLFQNWLCHLIAVPAWPFPEEVIITSYASENSHGWMLVIPSFQKNLPYYSAPANFTLIPMRDKYSAGWNFQYQQNFIIKKAGEA